MRTAGWPGPPGRKRVHMSCGGLEFLRRHLKTRGVPSASGVAASLATMVSVAGDLVALGGGGGRRDE
eukprot:1153716-Pyramimonas_sp.AAC.1